MSAAPAEAIRRRIYSSIQSVAARPDLTVADETPLLGEASIMDSMRLVEVCLLLEDLAAESGFEFDWTSDVAMSRARSMFRTAGSLADEFLRQLEARP